MQISQQTGLLDCATYIASPNCDERPDERITLVVIHNISLPPGEFNNSYITQLFTNQLNPEEHEYFEEIAELRVSSHLLICRTGEIIQYVPFNKRAWHAGVSSYLGQTVCNDFSVGIELEGTDNTPFTDQQYQVLVEVLKTLVATYPGLEMKHITGHEHIAPGRKTDPGPHFDWEKLGSECQANLPAIANIDCG